eukprot:891-Pyramimonas_sp.AAC.1
MNTLGRYYRGRWALSASSKLKTDSHAALRMQGRSSHWMIGARAMWRAAAERTLRWLKSSANHPQGWQRR